MLEVVGDDDPRDMIVTHRTFGLGGDRTRLTARQQSGTPAPGPGCSFSMTPGFFGGKTGVEWLVSAVFRGFFRQVLRGSRGFSEPRLISNRMDWLRALSDHCRWCVGHSLTTASCFLNLGFSILPSGPRGGQSGLGSSIGEGKDVFPDNSEARSPNRSAGTTQGPLDQGCDDH